MDISIRRNCDKCDKTIIFKNQLLCIPEENKGFIFWVDEKDNEGKVELCGKCLNDLIGRIKGVEALLRKPMNQWTREIIVKKFLEEK